MTSKQIHKIKIIDFIIIITMMMVPAIYALTNAIYALTNYFSKQTKDKIQLMTDLPTFEVNKVGGNNEEKFLISLSFPNLNPQRYAHLITIDYEAILNPNEMDISTPLYLKITHKLDSHQTFNHPEKYFEMKINTQDKNNNIIKYEDAKRPQMIVNEQGVGKIKINIKLEQKAFLKVKNAELSLICDYELVDTQGKGFTGGNKIIDNKITQLV